MPDMGLVIVICRLTTTGAGRLVVQIEDGMVVDRKYGTKPAVVPITTATIFQSVTDGNLSTLYLSKNIG